MPDTDTDDTLPIDAEGDSVRKRLEAAERQIGDYKMLVADFENARKRTARDAEQSRKYASEGLARDLLAALDNLDRALDAAKQAGDGGPLAAGVSATASQMLDVLRRHGVTKIDIGPGSPFDPNHHQAVMQQPSTAVPPGSVLHVLQQGFMLHDRVLRPASVVVASDS